MVLSVCVTHVWLQEKVLWLCPMELKQPQARLVLLQGQLLAVKSIK